MSQQVRRPPAGRNGAGPVLELADVVKEYPGSPPVRALDGVSLAGRARARWSPSSDPSGSGKSTLLHLVGALDRPSSGAVRIAGHDIARLRDRAAVGLRGRAHRLRVPAVPPHRGADAAGERGRSG